MALVFPDNLRAWRCDMRQRSDRGFSGMRRFVSSARQTSHVRCACADEASERWKSVLEFSFDQWNPQAKTGSGRRRTWRKLCKPRPQSNSACRRNAQSCWSTWGFQFINWHIAQAPWERALGQNPKKWASKQCQRSSTASTSQRASRSFDRELYVCSSKIWAGGCTDRRSHFVPPWNGSSLLGLARWCGKLDDPRMPAEVQTIVTKTWRA